MVCRSIIDLHRLNLHAATFQNSPANSTDLSAYSLGFYAHTVVSSVDNSWISYSSVSVMNILSKQKNCIQLRWFPALSRLLRFIFLPWYHILPSKSLIFVASFSGMDVTSRGKEGPWPGPPPGVPFLLRPCWLPSVFNAFKNYILSSLKGWPSFPNLPFLGMES